MKTIIIHLPRGVDVVKKGVDRWRYVDDLLIVTYEDGREETFRGGIVGIL